MQGTQMTRASVNTFGYGMVPCNVQHIHCGSQLMCTVCICVYVVGVVRSGEPAMFRCCRITIDGKD